MANKIYRALGQEIRFQDSDPSLSGVDYVKMSLASLAVGTGRASALYDRGVGSKPMRYHWRAGITWATTGVVWHQAELFLAEGDGTVINSNWSADSALPAPTGTESFRWAIFLGRIYCCMTTSAFASVASGVFTINSRYFLLGLWNRSATKILNATANTSRIVVREMPDEVQGT